MPYRVVARRSIERSRLRALARRSGSDPAEVSRVRGRVCAFAIPGAFRRDCSPRKLRPDPIGSDTCRREARRVVGWRGRPRRAHTCLRVPMTSPPGGPACARPTRHSLLTSAPPAQSGAHDAPLVSRTSSRARLGRRPLSRPPPAPGPLPAPLREERRVLLHPRCLPSMCFPIRARALALARSGVGQLSTSCPQPVEYWLPAPLRSSRGPTAVDEAVGREDSVCLRWPGP